MPSGAKLLAQHQIELVPHRFQCYNEIPNEPTSFCATTGVSPLAARIVPLIAISMLGHHVACAAPPIEQQNFDCVIEAQQTVKLASSAMGVVAELSVDRGDVVRQGQVLGKLDDSVEAANLALAENKAANGFEVAGHRARLAWLRKKFSRAQELVANRITSLNATDEVESDMKVEEQQLLLSELQQNMAELEVIQAKAAVAQRSFASPVNGVVVERLLSVGEYRNDQSPILTLAEIDPLRVEVFVPTSYYRQVAVGSVGYVRPEQPVGGDYAATVTVVDRVVDAASGTFGVRLRLSNMDMMMPAGLKCKIRFDGAGQAHPKRPMLDVASPKG